MTTPLWRLVKLHLNEALPVLVAFYLPALLALGVVVWAKLFQGISPSYFTVDPLALGRLPFYAGFLSNLGVLLWCASAAVYLFASFLVRGQERAADRRFLRASGLLTAFLLCDDLFMLHEQALPTYLHIPEAAVYAAYGATVGWYLFKSRSPLLRTEFTLLGAAFLFLGGSVLIDACSGGRYLSEDGLKFLGIVAWAVYACRTSWRMAEATREARKAAPPRPLETA